MKFEVRVTMVVRLPDRKWSCFMLEMKRVSEVRLVEFGSTSAASRRSTVNPAREKQIEEKYFQEFCSGSEAGSYLRLRDFCITQLQA